MSAGHPCSQKLIFRLTPVFTISISANKSFRIKIMYISISSFFSKYQLVVTEPYKTILEKNSSRTGLSPGVKLNADERELTA